MEDFLKQSAQATQGVISFVSSSTDQEIDLSTYLKSHLSQIVNSSCNITASNIERNSSVTITNSTGKFDFSQSGEVSNASCNIDNYAKYLNNVISRTDDDQSSKVLSIISTIIMFIIVGMVIISVIAMIGKVIVASKQKKYEGADIPPQHDMQYDIKPPPKDTFNNAYESFKSNIRSYASRIPRR
jgi:large-conductance mechanosensitive channel